MKILINSEQLQNALCKEPIPLECEHCGNIFYQPKNRILAVLKGNSMKNKHKYCSTSCVSKSQMIQHIVNCNNCGKEVSVQNKEFLKSTNHFCCRSCAVTYNNTHKTQGIRRSKLEKYLEEQIELNYPELKCLYNSKELINSELDFYFPTLKFAIELNGIFHYEPIYGQEKFKRIQNNDKQKLLACEKLGVELCIVNSNVKHVNDKKKIEFWNMVNEIIKNIYHRHSP